MKRIINPQNKPNPVLFIVVAGGLSTVYCCCRGPNQLQGDGGPGAKGMLDTDMMNILPTAMNMLVGLLR